MTPRAWAALLLVAATTMAPLAEADHLSPSPPLAPSFISAGPGDDIGEIWLSWRLPYWSASASTFRIFRGDSPGSATFLVEVPAEEWPGHSGTFFDKDRPLAKNAYYRVSAVNPFGESGLSALACSAPYPWAATRGDVAIDPSCDVNGGTVAVSGTGDARATTSRELVGIISNDVLGHGGCTWVTGTCVWFGGMAISVTGSASASRSHGCTLNGDPGHPCRGEWSAPPAALSVCDTLAAQGRPEACVSNEELLP